jgi:2-polyprenyl-6-methoxyphenol hydroxylase-like FAD-dependent oxidoreductase
MDHYASATGRVIVIGDAAHAITPQGGQGAAMAFEDTETLAYTISQLDFVGNWRKLLGIWEKHRQERLEMVKDFTNRNASLRDPGRGYLRQKIKEYIVWGVFKYMGPSAGVEWLYGYNAEDIVGILRPSCESTS